MLPTKTTIALDALPMLPNWSFANNTLCRHVNDDQNFDCFDYVAIEAQSYYDARKIVSPFLQIPHNQQLKKETNKTNKPTYLDLTD